METSYMEPLIFYFSRGFYFYNKSADYLGEFQTYPVLDWIHD